MMFVIRTAMPTTSTTPIISAGSRSFAARTASEPIPGHAKICSVMTAPATSSGSSSPITVMIGISEFRNAWRRTTTPGFSPLARRGGDVVAVEHLQHRGPRVPQQRRGRPEPQHHGRQDQVPQEVPDTGLLAQGLDPPLGRMSNQTAKM